MRIYYYLSLLIFLTACVEQNVAPDAEDIYGLWRYQSGISFELEVEENPLAYIDLKSDSTLSGFTSRNQLIGNFEFDRTGKIYLMAMLTTRVADTPWSIAFFDEFTTANRYELQENELILKHSENEELLVFLKISEDTCQPAKNDGDRFRNETSDTFELIDVNLLGTCLETYIGYGGGCGGMTIELVGGSDYAESLPPQLSVRLIMDDDDNCEAYVRENVYFDLSDLQYDDYGELLLKIEGWETPVLVKY